LIVVAALIVVAVESRSSHGVTHRGPGPLAARTLLLAAFAVEARAQLSTGVKPASLRHEVDAAERTMVPAAVRWFAGRIARDETDARRGRAFGDQWDRARTWITSSIVLGSTATSVQLLVNIEDAMHIAGTRVDSLSVTPYVVDLTRAPKGAWRIQRLAFQDSYDAYG
jgi:hypothetical protein